MRWPRKLHRPDRFGFDKNSTINSNSTSASNTTFASTKPTKPTKKVDWGNHLVPKTRDFRCDKIISEVQNFTDEVAANLHFCNLDIVARGPNSIFADERAQLVGPVVGGSKIKCRKYQLAHMNDTSSEIRKADVDVILPAAETEVGIFENAEVENVIEPEEVEGADIFTEDDAVQLGLEDSEIPSDDKVKEEMKVEKELKKVQKVNGKIEKNDKKEAIKKEKSEEKVDKEEKEVEEEDKKIDEEDKKLEKEIEKLEKEHKKIEDEAKETARKEEKAEKEIEKDNKKIEKEDKKDTKQAEKSREKTNEQEEKEAEKDKKKIEKEKGKEQKKEQKKTEKKEKKEPGTSDKPLSKDTITLEDFENSDVPSVK